MVIHLNNYNINKDMKGLNHLGMTKDSNHRWVCSWVWNFQCKILVFKRVWLQSVSRNGNIIQIKVKKVRIFEFRNWRVLNLKLFFKNKIMIWEKNLRLLPERVVTNLGQGGVVVKYKRLTVSRLYRLPVEPEGFQEKYNQLKKQVLLIFS